MANRLFFICAGLFVVAAAEELFLPIKHAPKVQLTQEVISFETHITTSVKTKIEVVQPPKRTSRNAIVDVNRLWPAGRVPFVFDSNVPAFSKVEILAAMQEIESSVYSTGACITFIPRQSETDYLHISWTNGTHGSTHIGRAGGRQELTINTKGRRGHDDNLNILMIVLGLYPEAMRSDRDQYVNIDTSNIRSAQAFNKLTGGTTDFFGQSFDYTSLLLYTPYQYSLDHSRPAMTAQQANVVMGQSVSMSQGDVTLLQHTYQCPIDTSNRVDILQNTQINCHFHTGFCNLVQDQRDNFDWILSAGPRKTQGTGPNADYSSGSGHFALAQALNHNNQIAKLTTSTYSAGEYCLRMSMYMYGSDMGQLEVIASHTQGQVTVFKQAGALTDEWYHVYIEINSKADFNLIFQATMGNGDKSDIALDDIYIYNGLCIEWD